ncbi:MAG TPA: BamA/TamA family outer membrane protein [Gemmatimonadales bacterium]|nr:BamA/TamA family outer membrane protein [Gemmatimonadales bacterium]
MRIMTHCGRAVFVALTIALLGPDGQAQQQSQRVVRKLSFEGNRAISDELLAAAISTTNSSWFARAFFFRALGLGAKRYFDEEEFRRDVVRLDVLYKRSGYPDAVVDTIVRRDPADVYVTFRITEGEPIRVTSLVVTGLDSLPLRLRRGVLLDLPLQEGDPFNRFNMQASADSITRRLRDRGYPSAGVFTAFESNRETKTAEVTLEAEPDGRAVIGRLEVVGANRVDTGVVGELLVARPGRRYSQEELFESQRNLYESDLFRFATVNIDSAAYRPGDTTVPLIVQVNESKPRRIRGGLGYATYDCFRGSLGWTTRDFLGAGRILDLTSRVSKVGLGDPVDWGLDRNICETSRFDSVGSAKVNYYLGASVRRPAFLSPNNAITVSVFTERRSEFKVYLRQETGASVALTRTTPRRRNPLSLTYTVSYGRTEATALSFCSVFGACTADVVSPLRQRLVLATITALGTFARVNSPLDPTRGSVRTVELTHSSKYIGSSSLQQFTRVAGGISWYRPISRDVVLSWRVRGGVIFSPTLDVGTASGAFVPPDQRFYAGGPNDVRGFERNELGPVVYVVPSGFADVPDSVRVAATGGNTMLVGNVELRVPSPIFSSRFRLAAFVDAGGLWQRQGPQSSRVVRVTPGVGIRVATPLGPARLDLAYNPYKLQPGTLFEADPSGALTPVPGQNEYVLSRDRKYVLHIAVGQPF